jgi:hypothetical protein
MSTVADAAERALVFLEDARTQLGAESLSYTDWSGFIQHLDRVVRELANARVRPLAGSAKIEADTVAISQALDELAALLSAARDESLSFELDLQLDGQASPPDRNSARDAYALADAITRAAVSVRDQVR